MKKKSAYPVEYSMAYFTDVVPWMLRRSYIVEEINGDKTIIKAISRNQSAIFFELHITSRSDKLARVAPKIIRAELFTNRNRVILKPEYAREMALMCHTTGRYQR